MKIKPIDQRAYLGTFATSLFIQGCTVLQGVLLARLLGPVGRGEFATLILWPNVFAGIGILGVNMAIARFAGQGRSVDGLVKTATKAALVTGAISALICGLALPDLLPVGKHNLLPGAYLFLCFIPINHLGMNLQGVDHGMGNFAWLNTTRALIYPIFFSGVALCWWFATDKIFWVAFSLLVANGSVVLLRLLAKKSSFLSSDQSEGTKKLLKASLPFVAASVISISYMQMDKVLLVWLLAPKEIGLYVAAFAAAGSVNVLNSALGIVQFSSAAQSKPGFGFPALASVLRRGCIMSIVGGGVLAALLPWLLPMVYGDGFRPATIIGLVLLPGLIMAGLGEIINQALRGQGQPVAGVISKILGLVVMGIAGVLLAKLWGGMGIACGYLVGELVAFGGLMIVAIRYYSDSEWLTLCPTMADASFLWSKILRREEASKI
jgi:O-antigen/teichoic acid export membrane protein